MASKPAPKDGGAGKGLAAMLVSGLPKPGGEGEGEEDGALGDSGKFSCASDMMAAIKGGDVEMFISALDDYLSYGRDEE